MSKKILFPTDFSHCGDTALELACSLARDMDAKLLIVHVEEMPSAYGGGEMYYGFLDPPVDEIKRMLKDVVPKDENVGYEHRLLGGEAASAIVRCAEQEGADMIIMGTHGRSGLKRMLMGSVTEAVVRKAKCPVLTLKNHSDKLVEAE